MGGSSKGFSERRPGTGEREREREAAPSPQDYEILVKCHV